MCHILLPITDVIHTTTDSVFLINNAYTIMLHTTQHNNNNNKWKVRVQCCVEATWWRWTDRRILVTRYVKTFSDDW